MAAPSRWTSSDQRKFSCEGLNVSLRAHGEPSQRIWFLLNSDAVDITFLGGKHATFLLSLEQGKCEALDWRFGENMFGVNMWEHEHDMYQRIAALKNIEKRDIAWPLETKQPRPGLLSIRRFQVPCCSRSLDTHNFQVRCHSSKMELML